MNQKQDKLILCWLLILTVFLLSAWTNTLKTNTPGPTDDPREADDRMREIKAAFVERLDVDHYFTASSTSTYDAADTGKHEFVTLLDMASDPGQTSGEAHIYMKGDELFYQDDTSTTCQITKDGEIEWESISDVNNATWIKSVDAAGTGTVNLIKADANDEQILPDGIRLETDAAPVQDEDITNKKYVDDQISTRAQFQLDGTIVFNTIMTAANTFQDLDLSARVGVNAALVFLEVTNSANANYAIKPKGYGSSTFTDHFKESASIGGCMFDPDAADAYGYIIVATDSSGVVQHASNNNTTCTWTIKLVGYVK